MLGFCGAKCRLRCLKINRLIKSAAGAASFMTKTQGGCQESDLEQTACGHSPAFELSGAGSSDSRLDKAVGLRPS